MSPLLRTGLHFPGLAEGRTNAQYEEQMRPELTNLWVTWRLDVKEIVVDEKARKAKQDKEYVFEFIFILHMTPAGEKIEKVIEYIDTHVVAQVSRLKDASPM